MRKRTMRSTNVLSQRQEEHPIPGPSGLTSQQLRQVPSFNRRRLTLLSGEGGVMVRNQPVVDGPASLTVSHITQGTTKSAKRVRFTILENDDDLPKCRVASCTKKAHYSLGDGNVIVCSMHRKGQHVKVFGKKASRFTCHCGARATYRDDCRVPKYCYWHKTSNSETSFSFQRFSMHHRGQFVGSYTLPKVTQVEGQGPHGEKR